MRLFKLKWPFSRKPQTRPVQYTETLSGFRYRLLDVDLETSYESVLRLLWPGEQLYRMMDGDHRVGGKPFPVLMGDRTNFNQSVYRALTGEWFFRLAAGIPAPTLRPETSVFSDMLPPEAHRRGAGHRYGER